MKTATDLLKEILANQNTLDKKTDTTNFLLTTLISRIDQLQANKKPEVKRPPSIEAGTNTSIIQQAEPPKENKPVQPTTIVPVQSSGLSEEKFAIVQQIKRNNTGVWLCNIVVTDSNNQVVFDGKTARNGQWTTVLASGDYKVVISRGAGQEAAEINITDNFSVSASKVKNGKITLPEIKL